MTEICKCGCSKEEFHHHIDNDTWCRIHPECKKFKAEEDCVNCGKKEREHYLDNPDRNIYCYTEITSKEDLIFKPQKGCGKYYYINEETGITFKCGRNGKLCPNHKPNKDFVQCDFHPHDEFGRCLTEDRLKKKHQNQASNVVDRAMGENQ